MHSPTTRARPEQLGHHCESSEVTKALRMLGACGGGACRAALSVPQKRVSDAPGLPALSSQLTGEVR